MKQLSLAELGTVLRDPTLQQVCPFDVDNVLLALEQGRPVVFDFATLQLQAHFSTALNAAMIKSGLKHAPFEALG